MYMCKPGGYLSDQVHSGLTTLTWPYGTTPSPNGITKKIDESRNFGSFSRLNEEEPPFLSEQREFPCTTHCSNSLRWCLRSTTA